MFQPYLAAENGAPPRERGSSVSLPLALLSFLVFSTVVARGNSLRSSGSTRLSSEETRGEREREGGECVLIAFRSHQLELRVSLLIPTVYVPTYECVRTNRARRIRALVALARRDLGDQRYDRIPVSEIIVGISTMERSSRVRLAYRFIQSSVACNTAAL